MPFKNIAIITNTNKKDAVAQTPKLIDWLQKKGIDVKVAKDVATELKCEGLACDKDELVRDTDLIITMGGDGTVLRAVSILQGKPVPILAIDYGKFGFLQEVNPDDLFRDLELVLAGESYFEEKKLLKAKFNHSTFYFLNDLVVSHDGFRIMQIKTFVNGTYFYEYAADGMAIATATGSSAYSFSAGGPIVSPGSDVTLITPLNPHTLLNRSIVLPADDVITLKIASIDGKLKLSGDGLLIYHGEPIDIAVSGSDKTVIFLKLRESDFFAFLRKKLVTLVGVNNVD